MRLASFLAALSFSASSYAQAVPEGIAPDEPAPEGCEETANANFTIGILNLSAKHRRETATEATNAALACTLKDGVLHDSYGRTGSIVANYQFQFDGPPQAGAIYTGGFSVCQNNSLAIGDSTIWYRCMSGEFGNLYDRSIGDQCAPVNIVVSYVNEPLPSASSASPSIAPSSAVATSRSDSAPSSPSSQELSSATASINDSAIGTAVSTGVPSTLSSAPASGTSASPTGTETGAPEAPANTGGAVPRRELRRETFGAVIGILGAALIL